MSITRSSVDQWTHSIFFFQAEDGIRDLTVTGVQTCALPILSADEQEVARMEIIARDRAEVASPKWREDVLRRKLTIAQGKGTVHGRSYDLDRDFAIGLDPIESTAPLTAVA